ncbi:MAG: VPA1269 family protein [Pseudomonas kermanshahensis]|uniref:gamma-mobile-trio integrase GmtZ n=1 Tax=Pseudomonas kermanshahensis TaxID=2745482 RepID=UPI003D0CAFAC
MGKIKNFYPTFEEAREACIRLKITTVADYKKRRTEDPRLPSAPHEYYPEEWRGHLHFIGQAEPETHTFEDAKCAVLKLGITSSAEYTKLYKRDFRLPSRPDQVYISDWKGWIDFLDKEQKYSDYYEARAIARSYHFRTASDYRDTCLEIEPRFYAAPQLAYKEWNGWNDYLGLGKEALLKYEDARDLVRNAGITTRAAYIKLRADNPRLPAGPESTYKKMWHGWLHFLGLARKPYEHYHEAQAAVRALGIATKDEYHACFSEDTRLPQSPDKKYPDWKDWEDFLGGQPKYPTIEEATAAVRKLGIDVKNDYVTRFSEDPMLPKRPEIFYQRAWPKTGWRAFLFGAFYPTMRAAAAAARGLGVVLITDYARLRHGDPKLPGAPHDVYKDYTTWADFILPEKCSTLEETKFAVKYLGIKDSKEYREKQPKHPCLPANPDRSFPHDWVDWFDLCDIIKPYPYEEAIAKLQPLGLSSALEYKAHIIETGDNRFPLAPDKVYDDAWINWTSFLGKTEPYTISTLRAPYEQWQPAIVKFLRSIRGASTKENYIVRYVRDFLAPRKIGRHPTDIFTSDRFNTDEFKLYITTLKETLQRKVVNALKEFSEHYICSNLSIECEDTRERIMIEGARDPFMVINPAIAPSFQPSETVKPCLAFHHVAGLRDWIIPPTAQSFSDLTHLHEFEADWYEFDENLIDTDDPNCVYKFVNGKCRIWFPGAWMHTYALASVPLRGFQIAYADSGEGDQEIPVIRDGKIEWIINPNRIKGKPKPQGFIKRYEDDEIGMHVTTNKTSRKRPTYNVPWMPAALGLWCIRLREWQTKYNPITRAMPWIECRHTNYSEKDLLAKGSNCFLFRELGAEECSGSFSPRLHNRIAIALYNSQPQSVELATLNGNPNGVTSYTSIYTPHTMRVSLITAYVMDERIPMEMIVKIVGHSSVVMTMYYVKINEKMMRLKFTEAEKRALSSQAREDWQKIQQGRTEQVRHALITNNSEAITRFAGSLAPGSTLFRDYGLCPYAADRCHDGFMAEVGKWTYVPAGYLGSENCIRCRHFITGPVFLGGLLSLSNEISLAAKFQFDHIHDMEELNYDLEQRAKKCREDQSDIENAGGTYDTTELDELESQINGNYGQISTASRTADMYLSDMNGIKRLVEQCQAVLNEQVDNDRASNATQLIVQEEHEVMFAFEETSFFQQLSEVCENAQIYVSAKADLALTTRSQHLDRLLQLNELQPTFFRLDKRQQLVIGNQATQFLLSRLGSWDNLDAVVDGRLLMCDLPENQRLTTQSFEMLLKGEKANAVLAYALENDNAQRTRNTQDAGVIEYTFEQVGKSIVLHSHEEYA